MLVLYMTRRGFPCHWEELMVTKMMRSDFISTLRVIAVGNESIEDGMSQFRIHVSPNALRAAGCGGDPIFYVISEIRRLRARSRISPGLNVDQVLELHFA